ncbi:MAG: RNase H family protein [Chitinophagaceae bacterium]
MIVENKTTATIYTDGSCNTEFLAGAWVAIVLTNNEKKQISGLELNTTHNRMELTAVIKAIEYIKDHYNQISFITICSDSQYVIGLPARKERIMSSGFTSKKGKALPNDDLVKKLLALFDLYTIECVKIKAHQKKQGANAYNIEVDILSRKLVRATINKKFI